MITRADAFGSAAGEQELGRQGRYVAVAGEVPGAVGVVPGGPDGEGRVALRPEVGDELGVVMLAITGPVAAGAVL